MKPAAPLISVIIRTIGHPELPRAIRSVLKQRYGNLEIVLVLARPGLTVPEIAAPIPLHAVGGDKAYARAAAGNLGLQAARGAFGIFLDEDDEWDETHLTGLVEGQGATAHVAGYCDTRMLDRNGQITARLGGPYKAIRLYTAGIFCIHACLFPIETVRVAGLGFDPSLATYEDLDFWIQLEPHLEYRYIAQCTAVWHGEAGSSGAGIGGNNRDDVVIKARRILLDKWCAQIADRAGTRDELVAVGRELVQKKHWSDAVGLLNAVLLRNPDWPDALNLSGFAHMGIGEHEQAIARFRRTLEAADHYGVRYNLALALEAAGRFDAATAEAQQVLRQNAGFEPAKKLLARLTQHS